MPLPEHADVSLEMIEAMALSHGLASHPIRRLPDTGIFNAVYLLGTRYVLRVPRRHPAHFRALAAESLAVPLARQAGVRTPALLVYDDSATLLPVPYTIYERVHGEALELLGLEPDATPEVWRELGRDYVRLHCGVDRIGAAAEIPDRPLHPDPRQLAGELATEGWITDSEGDWLARWLDGIAEAAQHLVTPRLLHGDSQATNVMVDRACRYVAVIDWGSAGWGDPALDFAGIPLRAVPYLLEGYRSVAPVEANSTLEARILWRHLQLALLTARRGPMPGQSWAERPLPMLLEIVRFFFADPPSPWSELRP